MNTDIVLTRTTEQNGKQTVGSLVVPDTDFKCITLELPFEDNKQNVSCIPPEPKAEQIYEWERLESSPSFDYPHLWIRNVPNRSFIKVHRANFATGEDNQLLGCISVGDGFTDINKDGYSDTTNSKDTLKKLLSNVGQEGTIKIISQVGYY